MTDETKPTSDWGHSHALNEGDELTDQWGESGTVENVHDDGSVTVSWESGEEVHSESSMNTALANGDVERADGKSHELATY